MTAHTHSASCSCGQVVFDLSKKKPGQVLVCPWCGKKYLLHEGDRIEALEQGVPPPPAPSPPGSDDHLKRSTLIVRKRNVTSTVIKKTPSQTASAQSEAPAKPKTLPEPVEETKEKSALGARRSQSSVFTQSKVAKLRKAVETGVIPKSDEGGQDAAKGKAGDAKPDSEEAGPDDAEESASGENSKTQPLEPLESSGESKRKKKKKKKKKKKRAEASEPGDENSETQKIEFDELDAPLEEDDDPGAARVGLDAVSDAVAGSYQLEGESVDLADAIRSVQKSPVASDRSVPNNSRRSRTSALLDADSDGELLPPPPITMEKLVIYMFIAAVPIGAIAFAIHMWWGIKEGTYQFMDREVFGITIRGNNPWVWVGGILLGALTFLAGYIIYTYLSIKFRRTMGEDKGKSGRGGTSMRSRRSRKAEDAG